MGLFSDLAEVACDVIGVTKEAAEVITEPVRDLTEEVAQDLKEAGKKVVQAIKE